MDESNEPKSNGVDVKKNKHKALIYYQKAPNKESVEIEVISMNIRRIRKEILSKHMTRRPEESLADSISQ
ncbi:28751_t:CDS:2 [Dentiscutata erythropus]|uniref:28751_t:CDS:1 n=1 Tax=Dentiscutata erythropus TaxID=1348616 RepID=A0A9N9IQ73_9GLOM|nr:28751_t:CDS:2 [Dentiscutata erythropus]